VAVLGPDLAGATALVTLVDAGLDATGVGGRPTGAAADLLAAYALTDRWLVPAGACGDPAGAADPRLVVTRAAAETEPHGLFQISLGGEPMGHWDAVVVTARGLAAVAGVLAAAPWFGAVFHPVAGGVFLLGVPDSGQVGRPDSERDLTVTKAQAGWVAEYLRGRYLLPAGQAMLDHPGLRRTGVRRGAAGYLRALDRELRAGRSRAAAAGYPLPLPAARPASPATH
jgi:hypothetical protein